MAYTVVTGAIILSNRMIPGVPVPLLTPPCDGFVNPAQHNVATPALPVGTKITVYQSGNGTTIAAGYYTMLYAQVGTQDTGAAITSGSLCARETATAWDWKFTNSSTNAGIDDIGIYAISTMTNSYYGWFWCDGVAPDFLISGTTYPNTVVTVAAKATLEADGGVAADTCVIGYASTTHLMLSPLLNSTVGNGFGLAVHDDA
jgi:hypothetical protein